MARSFFFTAQGLAGIAGKEKQEKNILQKLKNWLAG